MTEATLEVQKVTRRISNSGLDGPRIDKFTRIVKTATEGDSTDGDVSFTIIVAQIDPDALGSAFGMQALLDLLGHGSVIYYSGRVSHPQNEALCNKFNLLSKMTHISKIADEHKKNVILVDSNRAKDSRMPVALAPVIVVDHHRDSDVVEDDNSFVWLDEEIGAASTQIVELLNHLAPPDWKISDSLALMLALGIYTDTKEMIRAGSRDQECYAWCKRYANYGDLLQMILYKRPFSFLKNLARAVGYVDKRNTFRQGRIVASLGHISSKQGDDLAMIADEFLRTTGVVLAVTWAVVEHNGIESVRVCARSEDLTLNLGNFLKERFGEKSGAKLLPDGAGEGGALVELEVGPWLRKDEMVEAVGLRIIEWLFDHEDPVEEKE